MTVTAVAIVVYLIFERYIGTKAAPPDQQLLLTAPGATAA
jgi:hypothetical protein